MHQQRPQPAVNEQPFRDRRDAGRVLAERLRRYAGRDDVVVLALPRGGVPVAYEVARALRAPLDVFVVRKLGVPGHAEFAMGAVGSGGTLVLDDDVVRDLRIPPLAIERVAERETRELARREREYRGGRTMTDLTGKVVILVDDGLATGSSMRAAIQALSSSARPGSSWPSRPRPNRRVGSFAPRSTRWCARRRRPPSTPSDRPTGTSPRLTTRRCDGS